MAPYSFFMFHWSLQMTLFICRLIDQSVIIFSNFQQAGVVVFSKKLKIKQLRKKVDKKCVFGKIKLQVSYKIDIIEAAAKICFHCLPWTEEINNNKYSKKFCSIYIYIYIYIYINKGIEFLLSLLLCGSIFKHQFFQFEISLIFPKWAK